MDIFSSASGDGPAIFVCSLLDDCRIVAIAKFADN